MPCFCYSVNSVVENMVVTSGPKMPHSVQKNMFLLERDSTTVLEKQFRAFPHTHGSTASEWQT